MSAGNPERIAAITEEILTEYAGENVIDVVAACQTIIVRACAFCNAGAAGVELTLAGIEASAADMRELVRRSVGH